MIFVVDHNDVQQVDGNENSNSHYRALCHYPRACLEKTGNEVRRAAHVVDRIEILKCAV
jgi:hypothetical protein